MPLQCSQVVRPGSEKTHLANLVRQRRERANNLIPLRPLAERVLRQRQRNHGDDHDLAGVRLGGCDPYLTPRVYVHSAVGHARDCAAYRVGDTHAERTTALDVIQSLQTPTNIKYLTSN